MEMMQHKALVVENDARIRAHVKDLLVDQGWDAIEGRNAEEAVALALAESPDLIFLDILMPGTDGILTYRVLQDDDRTAHIPIVMMSVAGGSESGASGEIEPFFWQINT